jgi:acyl-CoA reductase-like NAD-dependent aldehyde dehydrogenase
VTPPDPNLSGGLFISPAVVVDVTDDMQIAREEVFGPVACIFPFDSEDEVVRRANDSELGLAGGVFTK